MYVYSQWIFSENSLFCSRWGQSRRWSDQNECFVFYLRFNQKLGKLLYWIA